MTIVEQVPYASGVGLRDNIIANCVSCRSCISCIINRLLQHLRVAGMVISIDKIISSLINCCNSTLYFLKILTRPDTIMIISIFRCLNNIVNTIVVLFRNPRQPVLQVVFIGNLFFLRIVAAIRNSTIGI